MPDGSKWENIHAVSDDREELWETRRVLARKNPSLRVDIVPVQFSKPVIRSRFKYALVSRPRGAGGRCAAHGDHRGVQCPICGRLSTPASFQDSVPKEDT